MFSSVLRVPVDYLIGDYLVESTETPEEQFNRLDADVREELIAEMLNIMKKKEAEKWQQLNGMEKDGASESAKEEKSDPSHPRRQDDLEGVK